MAEPRKEREADFHDRAFSEQTRRALWSKYYLIVESSSRYYSEYIERRCPGADVLEYGCGPSGKAGFLAARGAASVTGIDISPVAIEKERERASAEGVADVVSFRVMDAEELEFDDDSFDLVCGTSVIHHLDLDRTYRELSRVLRPGGAAIFVEPLGHNPLINLYRRRTPRLRTPDEHPLLISDVEAARRHFGSVETRFFHLLSLLAVPFRRTRAFDRKVRTLDAADRALFRLIPGARRYAWQVAIELREPLGEPAEGSRGAP